ncbi:hypothetical protein BD770DRAFT_406845 [Pilaira anomala]|nr:hypothetical protein BD770DRAFT_406845 [Pilaira anomala]
MENRANTQCDRCGRLFKGARGLAIHQRIGTRCVLMEPPIDVVEPEIPNQVAIENDREDTPVRIFDTPEEELVPLIEIEGYSLYYLEIPANLFRNLERERPELGRFVSLQNFAERATAFQTRILDYPLRFFYVILSKLFWFFRIVCIISLAFALYYTDSPFSCSAEINHFLVDIEK